MEHAAIFAKLEQDFQKLRAPQGYLRAGLPHFPGLFGRDSLIASWQLMRHEPSLARATLVRLAHLQGRRLRLRREEEPGKILHEYYEPLQIRARVKKRRVVLFWGSPYYGSVDATLLWLIVFSEYLRITGDRATEQRLWPNAIAAFRWIAEFADHNGDGFLDYESHNPRALAHQAWKDSSAKEFGPLEMPLAPVEVQGYAYAALRAFASAAEMRGDMELARRAQERAQALKDRFAAAFAAEDFFAFALDGNGSRIPWVTSNPGHLLFSGILSASESRRVADRLFARDLWTPYGVRTLSVRDPAFDWQSYHRGSVWPHDNWFFWLGLRKIGMIEEAQRVRDALLRAFHALGGKITELYAVPLSDDMCGLDIRTEQGIVHPSHPQAWASGALYDMLTAA